MADFQGFRSKQESAVPVPGEFFTELLPAIQNPHEIRALLYIFWALSRQEGRVRYVLRSEMMSDRLFMEELGGEAEAAAGLLEKVLDAACQRGALICADAVSGGQKDAIYVLNSPRGKATLKALEDGRLISDQRERLVVHLEDERPNIFRLYEENIGPLTPLMADELRTAETTYPMKWIEKAMRLAVASNVRRWRYVDAILKSWKEKGSDETDQPHAKKDRQRYISGEYDDVIQR